MTFLHIPTFLHRAPVAAVNSTSPRLGWLDRLAQWSDRQPARPHHMGSYIGWGTPLVATPPPPALRQGDPGSSPGLPYTEPAPRKRPRTDPDAAILARIPTN